MDVAPNLFGLVFDSIPVALCAIDGHGNIVRTNPALQQMLGWRPSERVGEPLASYLLEAIRDPAQALSWTVALSEAVTQGKTIHLNLPIHLRPEPSSEPLENVTGIVIAVDLGAERAPGAIVAIYGSEILASTEGVRARMFSAVSHELGSPMTNIALAAELLAASEPQDERQKRLIGIVRDEVARLQRLMAQFVAASPAKRHTTLARNMVTLRPLLRRVTQVFGLQKTGPEILTQIPPDLPFVWGDADAIQQVLGNLVDNALRRNPTGVPIRLEVDASPDEVRICVVDEGPAIPVGEQQDLFQPSPPSSERDQAGPTYGLGLSISMSLVKGMGGDLWYEESGPTQRSFCFTLPCAKGQPEAHQAEEV